MEINDFIKSVNDICSMSNGMQMPVKDLPHKLQQMLNEVNLLAEDVKRKESLASDGVHFKKVEAQAAICSTRILLIPSIESSSMA